MIPVVTSCIKHRPHKWLEWTTIRRNKEQNFLQECNARFICEVKRSVWIASRQAGTLHGIYDHFTFILSGTTVHCGGYFLICVCLCVLCLCLCLLCSLTNINSTTCCRSSFYIASFCSWYNSTNKFLRFSFYLQFCPTERYLSRPI